MSEMDRRQLTRMQQQLDSYRSKQLPLQALIADLEFLLSNVEGSTEEWKQRVLSKIGRLEDTYAIALDKKNGVLDDTDHQLVSAAASEIATLVQGELSRFEADDEAD